MVIEDVVADAGQASPLQPVQRSGGRLTYAKNVRWRSREGLVQEVSVISSMVLSIVLTFAASPLASAEPSSAAQLRKADAHASKVTDAEQFVDELQVAVIMAEDGQYGRMRNSQIERLHDARDEIVGLLEGHDSALELSPDERLALFNAQSVVTSILRNENKNRQVCRREVTTGSRLGKVECMTIAQIEARVRASRNATERMQTGFCVPGDGNACSK